MHRHFKIIPAVLAVLAICQPVYAYCPYNPPQTAPGGWGAPLPIVKQPMRACERRVVATQPREYLGEVFFNSSTGVGYPPGEWHSIDLSVMSGGAVPVNATSAVLSGIAIITNKTLGGGTQFGISYADMHVAFRAPGDTTSTLACNYSIQVMTALANEGVRSGVSVRVPLVNGKVEMAWSGLNFSGVGQLPYYGLNLTVQEFCLPE